LFPTARLAEMLPTPSVRRKFSEWRLARRILVYDADSAILPEGNNVLGLLRKFRSEAGLSADLRSSGAPSASPRELQLNWLKGGFQAVFLLDFNFTTNDDDDEDTPSPPSYADLGSEQQSDPTSMTSRQVTLSMPMANRPALLRTKHLPMSAFTANSTTSQRSGSTHHKHYFGHQQTGARDLASAAPAPVRAELVSRPSLSGTVARQSTSDPSANVAYNPFFDTIRQNIELSHGITERIPLRISRVAKDRIDDLPFTWLRELGRWAADDDEGTDYEDHFGESGSGSGSGISGGYHSGMSSDSGEDSGEDSGSGHEHAHHVRMDPSANNAETLDDPQAEGSEALAMQFYRIELGEQRRLMGVMEHHSKESGRIMEGGEKKGSKSKSKRSKRSKGTGRSSRGKHSSRDFPYSITAGVEKGAKNRQGCVLIIRPFRALTRGARISQIP
jgi:hypothetical protein